MKILGSLFLALTLIPGLVAQRDLKAGFGTQSQVVDLDAATGEIGNLGIQHLNGEIFATVRIDPQVLGLHFVSVFDGSGNGTSTRTWSQPGFAQASEWGFRDGASDGQALAFGFDFGIELVDANGLMVTSWETSNGTAAVPLGLIGGNVLDLGQAEVIRALAYDRSGNGGDGSFWTGNFDSSTFEVDLSGDILRSYANAGEVSYGFGIDPISAGGNSLMWVNSAPNAGTLAEYDLTTGTLTGRVMDPGQNLTSVQGGLDIVPASLGRGPNASGFDILHLQQGQPDEFRLRRLHLDVAGSGVPPSPVTRPGPLEPDILASLDDEAVTGRSDRGVSEYSNLSESLNVFFDIARNPGNGVGTGGLNGLPAVIFANVGPDAAIGVDATSNFLGIRELVHLQPLLTTPLPQVAVRSRGMTLTNDPMASSPSQWLVSLTVGMPFQPIGTCVRFQGLWVDSDVAFLPIALTNQLRFCRGEDQVELSGTYAECLGGNTFNADTSSGFFKVTNEETDPARSIVALSFTVLPGLANIPATTQALLNTTFRWDTDNAGMAEIFEGGDSLVISCLGTYRNGSEVTAGLIFAGTPAQNGAACDGLALQGWVGSDPVANANDYQSIRFTFTPDTFMNGAVFEFDADTDGGIATNGAAMAGVFVSVEFRDGTVSSDVLTSDLLVNPALSSVQL